MDKVLGDLRQWNETLDLNDEVLAVDRAILPAFLGRGQHNNEVVGRGAVPLCECVGASVAAEILQQWRDNPREDHGDITVRTMDYRQGAVRKIATGDVTTIPPDPQAARATVLPGRGGMTQECSSREG